MELCALSDLAGGDPQRNAEITLAVLGGEEGPAADATALNAAATLVVAGRAADLGEGLDVAREALRSGAAMATLSALRAAGKDLTELSRRDRRLDARTARGATRDALAGGVAAGARQQLGDRRGQARLAVAGSDRAGRRPGRVSPNGTPRTAPQSSPCSPRAATSAAPTPTSPRCAPSSMLPILCKDFFVDVWQVTEARVHGADAILVLLALVEDALAADLIQAAEDLEMEASSRCTRGRAGARARPRDCRSSASTPATSPRSRSTALARSSCCAAFPAGSCASPSRASRRPTTRARRATPAPTRCSSARRSCATPPCCRRSCGAGRVTLVKICGVGPPRTPRPPSRPAPT